MIKTMYIFLDIDGVLVKEDAPSEEIDLDEDLMKFDENCLNTFESIIRRYDNSKIVISSSWIEIFALETIKTLFSSDVAEKIMGATPRLNYPIKYFRHKEVINYLKQNDCEDEPWVAIDDIAEHFPPDAPVIVTNPYKGFDKNAANQLEHFLIHGSSRR
jgi:FMN phosphatase YigB (HAD superfamily)